MRSVTPAMFLQLIEALQNGTSLKSFVKKSKELSDDYPSIGTFYNYINADSARLNQYTVAREMFADSVIDEIIDIADDRGVDPQSARNRIQARQWSASKLKPKTYGDKLDIDLKGQIDVQAAVLAGRRRIGASLTPTTIENEPTPALPPPVDPFS